ncbi:MAG TPA: hypothetical protein VIN08_13935 [Ohtaekwangia sp.]|uniref:hypothetical protein n=1 Tax=Ohtaekwangia sp. TaxID=2066019 RepID=UPI002F9266CC
MAKLSAIRSLGCSDYNPRHGIYTSLIKLFEKITRQKVNFYWSTPVTIVMANTYTTYTMQSNHDKETAHRRLKRLRILLFIWLISLLATVIWFSLTS